MEIESRQGMKQKSLPGFEKITKTKRGESMNNKNDFDKKANFDFMIKTIKTLSYSQGFYGRLYRDIAELNQESIDEMIEKLPDFKKDMLNVVYFFEC